VARLDPVTAGRLGRVLVFLSVSGGAALLSKRERSVVARAGEIDDAAALAALAAVIDKDEVVHVPPDGLIADIGRHHRLFVRVPDGLLAPAFGDRLRRARELIERFGLHVGRNPPAAPPGSAPAHAVVFAPRGPRRS